MTSEDIRLIDLSVAPDGTYIIARMRGEHTLAMAKAATAQLRSFIDATGYTKVLIYAPDQRQMFGTLPSYEFGRAIASKALPRCQFAIVVTMDLTEARFMETVLQNRSIWVRYFNDDGDARAWLGVAAEGL